VSRSYEFDEALLVFPSLEGTPLPKAIASPRLVARVLAKLRAWHRSSQSRFQLAELDDRQLKDIGLTRSQAQVESRKSFWQG